MRTCRGTGPAEDSGDVWGTHLSIVPSDRSDGGGRRFLRLCLYRQSRPVRAAQLALARSFIPLSPGSAMALSQAHPSVQCTWVFSLFFGAFSRVFWRASGPPLGLLHGSTGCDASPRGSAPGCFEQKLGSCTCVPYVGLYAMFASSLVLFVS